MTNSVLIYDGNCPICLTGIGFIYRNSVAPHLEFLTSQTTACSQRFPDLSLETLNRSLVFVTETGETITGGSAIRHILVNIVDTPTWILSVFNTPGIIKLVSLLYAIIARNRHILSRSFVAMTDGTAIKCSQLITADES